MSTDTTNRPAGDPDSTGLPEDPDATGPIGGDAGQPGRRATDGG
jgi:hypothetical protein